MKDINDLSDILAEISLHLDGTNDDKYFAATVRTNELILSKNLGMGFNIGNAIKYLSRYTTTGYSKSGARKDLKKAIHYIMFELLRTIDGAPGVARTN